MTAWDRTPDDLRALGYPRDPGHLFGRLQRVATWDESGPVLSRAAKALSLDLSLPRIVEVVPSDDRSRRIVLALADGERIEAVHMPRDVRRPRVTMCISSQVGCAMGCTFCATARMGLVRNLEAHEIVGQLLAVMHRYGPRSAEQLNVVFMGMGEPLHNVEAVVRALDVMCDPSGLGVAPSRVTVSTAGHVAGLERLARARWGVPELAVSVNAATDEVRRHLMPVDKRWPMRDLRAALDRWPRRPHQKITLEYVLLDGVNDDLTSADRLAEWIGDLRHVVNLIPFNAWSGAPYREPPEARVLAFAERLHERGCLVKVRRSRGRDVRAACGTLVALGT
jgi:23S rRNA (adenine2503-C2)-methyltransferase